jgi:hypothetical protein
MIPTLEEFKQRCGRTGIRQHFKTKNDLGDIFTGLGKVDRFSEQPTAIPALREVRKACVAWLVSNDKIVRVSKPEVQQLCFQVHARIHKIVENTYGGDRDAGMKLFMQTRGTKPGPVGRTMDEDYWFEKVDPKHRGKGIVRAALTRWEHMPPGETRLGFLDWMENIYVPESEDDPWMWLINNRSEAWAKKITENQGVKYCDQEERKAYVAKIEGGRVKDAKGDVYDTDKESTGHSGKGWAIFIWAPDDTLYVHSHEADKFHHSSILAGGPVKCAGELKVEGGTLKKVTPKTGHYKVGPEELIAFLRFLDGKRVALSDLDVCPDPINNKDLWVKGNTLLPPTRPVPPRPGQVGNVQPGNVQPGNVVQPGNTQRLVKQWQNVGKP